MSGDDPVFKTSAAPSHIAYRAGAGEGGTMPWVEMGTVFQHRDGKGCEIRLHDGGVIILRPVSRGPA